MKPSSPLWYLAGLLIALASWVLATVVAAGAWEPVRDASITPVTQRADAAGKSIAVFTDIVQSDRQVTCRTVGAGRRITAIPKAALDITVEDDGNQWYLIGLLPQGSDDVRVGCSPADRKTDNASYGYATVSGFDSKANTGKGIAVLGSTIGAALAAFTFWTRRQRRRYARLVGTSAPRGDGRI